MSLDAVKEHARALLYMDIHKTPYSPLIVQHPFTSSGMVAIRGSEIYMLDLLESQENLDRWRKQICGFIDRASCFHDIFYMINQPYRLTFMSLVMGSISSEEFGKYLSSAYTEDEFPSSNIDRNALLEMFRYADRNSLMNPEELEHLETLPETVHIYRGVRSQNRKDAYAMSWTLSSKTARWFADRFNQKGTVYSADILKEHIFAFYDGRKESEIVVAPKYLMNVKKL